MVTKLNVRSSAASIPPLEVNVDTVYENFDVTRVTVEDEHSPIPSYEEWNIGIQNIYPLREYLETLVSTRVNESRLAETLMEALSIVAYTSVQAEQNQALMMMEILQVLEALQGGEN